MSPRGKIASESRDVLEASKGGDTQVLLCHRNLLNSSHGYMVTHGDNDHPVFQAYHHVTITSITLTL